MFFTRKLVSSALLALIVTAVTFLLVFANGRNTARFILGTGATEEQVTAKVVELGLDQPVVLQYLEWLGGLFTGDLGRSFYTGEQVTAMLTTRVPVTLSIVFISLLLTLVVSVLLGVAAAVKGGWIDRVLQVVGVGGAAVPNFVVAIGLVSLFAITVPLLPATGYVSPDQSLSGWAASLTLPVLAILIGSVANAAQQFRGAMIDVLEQDFIRTLRSRGIPTRQLVFRHALRNAAVPGLTVLSLQTIALMGGVVLIERVFALPGMGLLAQDAAIRRDIPAVMGVVLFSIVVVVVVNTVIDVVNGAINPKARLA